MCRHQRSNPNPNPNPLDYGYLPDWNLHVWIDWFSEFLQAFVRFTPEVLQDVFKVVFFTEIKL